MRVVTFFRVATLVLMAAALGAAFLRPELFPRLAKAGLWLVPTWIGVLFVVQSLTTPDATGTTTLESWGNRLRGRRWTCLRCGSTHRLDVLLCDDCGELRPDPAAQGGPWVCEVCETENLAQVAACRHCTVPRPE